VLDPEDEKEGTMKACMLFACLALLWLPAAGCGDDSTVTHDDGGPGDDGTGADGDADADADADVAADADVPTDTSCIPICGGLCGQDDGCGGICETGWCGAGSACVAGACACDFLDCFGTCCAEGDVCAAGECCTPDCAGRSCGFETACFSTCGTCDEGVCNAGTCGSAACVPVAPMRVAQPYRVHLPGLAVDSSGNAHVLYTGDSLDWDGSYRVVHNVGVDGTFTREIIDTVDEWGADIYADVDRGDRIHAAYFPIGTTGGPPRYATNASGTWAFEFPSLDAIWPSFVADADGHAYYLYAPDFYGWDVLSNATGTWVASTTEINGSDCAFDVAAAGKLHVVCLQGVCDIPRGFTESVVYQADASGSWVSTTIAPWDLCDTQNALAVAVDSTGAVHVADMGAGMRYMTNAGGTWTVEVVDAGRRGYPALAVDRAGRAHLAYSSTDGTKYATNAAGAWVVRDVGGSHPSNRPVVRVDGIARVHILYDDVDGALMYAAFCP
jgi:hypothetical protein